MKSKCIYEIRSKKILVVVIVFGVLIEVFGEF